MKLKRIHRWADISTDDAKKLQRKLSGHLVLRGGPDEVKTIAAGDLAFSRDGKAYAAVLMLSYPQLKILELHTGMENVRFPYIPGYLSFREAPLLLKLFEQLSEAPDLVMIDGQGIAHPRRLGLAAHIGLFLNVPTIGVAKSRLIGKYNEPGIEKGDWNWLTHKDERIGMVIRTRHDVKPIFVSPGNLIDYDNCLKWIIRTSIRYRIPEPTRQADREVAKFKKVASHQSSVVNSK